MTDHHIPLTLSPPPNSLVDHFLPFLRRLAERDWFTTRMAATGLFHHAYKYVHPRCYVALLSCSWHEDQSTPIQY